MASLPFFASPTTFMSASVFSICFRPWRTTGWSSAISTLITVSPLSWLAAPSRHSQRHALPPSFPAPGIGQRDEHARPLAAATATDVDAPVEGQHALPHAEQAQ